MFGCENILAVIHLIMIDRYRGVCWLPILCLAQFVQVSRVEMQDCRIRLVKIPHGRLFANSHCNTAHCSAQQHCTRLQGWSGFFIDSYHVQTSILGVRSSSDSSVNRPCLTDGQGHASSEHHGILVVPGQRLEEGVLGQHGIVGAVGRVGRVACGEGGRGGEKKMDEEIRECMDGVCKGWVWIEVIGFVDSCRPTDRTRSTPGSTRASQRIVIGGS